MSVVAMGIMLGVALAFAGAMTVIAALPMIVSAALLAAMLVFAAKFHGAWLIVAVIAAMLVGIFGTDLALDWWERRKPK